MPQKLRDDLACDANYRGCCAKDKNCSGRITWEHALYYAGKQIQEKWAIIPLCWYHHLGEGLVKDFNEWVALNRLFRNNEWLKEAKKKYPKAISSWKQRILFLNKKYDSRFKRGFNW